MTRAWHKKPDDSIFVFHHIGQFPVTVPSDGTLLNEITFVIPSFIHRHDNFNSPQIDRRTF